MKLTGNHRPTVRHSRGAQSGNLAQGTRNQRSASGLETQYRNVTTGRTDGHRATARTALTYWCQWPRYHTLAR